MKIIKKIILYVSMICAMIQIHCVGSEKNSVLSRKPISSVYLTSLSSFITNKFTLGVAGLGLLIGYYWYKVRRNKKTTLSKSPSEVRPRKKERQLYPKCTGGLGPTLFCDPAWKDKFKNVPLYTPLINAYIEDCRNQAKTQVMPPKGKNLRVATFNIFTAAGTDDYAPGKMASNESIIENIVHGIIGNQVGPDIIVLQEANMNTVGHSELLFKQMREFGYSRHYSSPIAIRSICMMFVSDSLEVEEEEKHRHGFVYAIHSTEKRPVEERRGYVRIVIKPQGLTGKKRLAVYGTHLDVADATDTVKTFQMQQLLQRAREDINGGLEVLIMGDLNAFDKQDYDKAYDLVGPAQGADILKRIVEQRVMHYKEAELAEPQDKLWEEIENAQFVDIFKTKVDTPRVFFPRWTAWTLTRVDWILAHKNGEKRSFVTKNAGVYYPVVGDKVMSDHVLVYADLNFASQSKSGTLPATL